MTGRVFLARPLSDVAEPAPLDELCRSLSAELHAAGWTVGPVREAVPPDGGRALVAGNVEGILGSDLLLVIGEPGTTSSIWVEVGVALAGGVPVAVLARPGDRLPFLVEQAAGDAPSPGLAPLLVVRHDVRDVVAPVAEPDARPVALVHEVLTWHAAL